MDRIFRIFNTLPKHQTEECNIRPPINPISHREQQQSHKVQTEEAEEEYNPLKIPCDWEFAKRHAKSRITAPDVKRKNSYSKVETCQCCGYELEKETIEYCSDPTKTLSFLGSGFPLFYNFMRYCIILLVIQMLVKQVYNLYTNLQGNYCSLLHYQEVEGKELSVTNCPDSYLLITSLANKLNNEDNIHTCQMLNFVGLGIIMIVLLHFRSVQRKIDNDVDAEHLTPADYTICVKNIPQRLDVDYKWELTNIFQHYAVLDSEVELIVKKVVLVYDIEEIVEKEKQLDKLIEKKKSTIKQYKY